MPEWLAYSSTIITVLGALVTAVATTFLWRVTGTLAEETKRMADAAGRPQVVVTLEDNRWAMNHADLHIENTGSGTAYDIVLAFDPPLKTKIASDDRTPIERLSVLKPGQRFSSYLSEFAPLLSMRFTVTVSWRRDPNSNVREGITYVLNMPDVANKGRLGPSDPAVELAEQVKRIREDWQSVASGSKRIKADVYASSDRLHERRQWERARRQRQRERQSPTGSADPS